MGCELFEQMGRVDEFVGMIGSGGMLVGVSQALKQAGAQARRTPSCISLLVTS